MSLGFELRVGVSGLGQTFFCIRVLGNGILSLEFCPESISNCHYFTFELKNYLYLNLNSITIYQNLS